MLAILDAARIELALQFVSSALARALIELAQDGRLAWWRQAYLSVEGGVLPRRFAEQAKASVPAIGGAVGIPDLDETHAAIGLQRLRLHQDRKFFSGTDNVCDPDVGGPYMPEQAPKPTLWKAFCRAHHIARDNVPLFATSPDGAVEVAHIGRSATPMLRTYKPVDAKTGGALADILRAAHGPRMTTLPDAASRQE